MAGLHVERVVRRFREPLVTAFGAIAERETLTVTLTGDDGAVGVGEAAPLEPYDGVSIEAVEAALAAYAQAISGLDEGQQVLDACIEVAPLPQALAAVDLALWDRASRRESRPIAAMLSDTPLDRVGVNATIGALDPDAAGEAADRAVAAGFSCLKVKVGTSDDERRLAAVRAAAGPGVAIRVDANGAWTVEQAADLLPRIDEAAGGLELCEEPVHGTAALKRVAALVPSVTIASDESGLDGAPTVCLKLSRSGGISTLCAQATFVDAQGGKVYLSSTFDGPIGITAALHCAAALEVELACGLATLDVFDGPVPDALVPVDGTIALPAGLGLH